MDFAAQSAYQFQLKTERTKNYLPRIRDKELEDLLADFGAVLIRGHRSSV